MSLNCIRTSIKATKRSISICVCLLVASFLSYSCQDNALDPLALSFKFGSCLGELEDEQSCSTRIFSSVTEDAVGCWVLQSNRVEQMTYQGLMRWSGRSLDLAAAESTLHFPFIDGDQVSMSLFVFDIPIGVETCSSLGVTSDCTSNLGCRARLTRRDFSLRFGQTIEFQDDQGQCIISAPQVISEELCDGIDNDCDRQIDEAPNCSVCAEGDERPCESLCGAGIERCQMGVYQGCDAPLPGDEICGGEDEDCDGELDEGLSCASCVEGDSRACETECGLGQEICENGAYIGCDAPLPTMEICNNVNDDCDEQVDEALSCGGCVDGERRSCANECGVGEETCIDGVYQGCDTPSPQPELCDLSDNDCDGFVDEETLKGASCSRQYNGCLGDFPGIYVCTVLGEECRAEAPSQDHEEVCDGVDNNCDGVIDNDPLAGGSCRGEVEGCAYSRRTCPPNIELGVSQDLICEGPLTPPADVCDEVDNDCDGTIDEGLPETCDGVDNNCDGEVDEGSVCGRLLYDHCRVSLGWAFLETTPMSSPWTQFPPLPNQATCTPRSDLDTENYSCKVTEAQSGFRTVNITTDEVGEDHWLGLAWDCDPTHASQALEVAEVELIEWARSHCVIGLGYWDTYQQSGSWNLSLDACNTFSVGNDERRQRCVKANATGQYAGIELEGVVDGNDQFGIAFACVDDTGLVPASVIERLQAEFRVFLGTQQDEAAEDRRVNWNNIPEDDIDDGGDRRGVGSLNNGAFNVVELRDNRRLYQFSIYTHLEE